MGKPTNGGRQTTINNCYHPFVKFLLSNIFQQSRKTGRVVTHKLLLILLHMQIISWKSCDSIHNKITGLKIIIVVLMYMLWFKISFGAKFLKLVQFLFSFVVYSLP